MSKNEAEAVDYFMPEIIPGTAGTLVRVPVPDNYYWPAGTMEGAPADIDPSELSQVNASDYKHQVLMEYRTGQSYGQTLLQFQLPYTTNMPIEYLTVFTVVNGTYKPAKKKRSAVMLSQIATDPLGLKAKKKDIEQE